MTYTSSSYHYETQHSYEYQYEYEVSYTYDSGKVDTRSISLPRDCYDRFITYAPRQSSMTQRNFMKVAQVIMMGPAASDSDIREAFNILDTDHSGHLDISELAKVIPAIMPGTTIQTLAALIRRYDKSYDNELSLKEFSNLIRKGLGRDLAFRDVLMIGYY